MRKFIAQECPRGHFSAMLKVLSSKGVAKGSLRRTEVPLETFTEPKELTENPQFAGQRQKSLAAYSDAEIDAPIMAIIENFNKLPFCFTLQSCYGHFLYGNQGNPQNLDPLPVKETMARVEYRIAYIAFCLDYSDSGRNLFEALKGITAIDPEYIQFGSAEWFWDRQVNSYTLQVEPDRFKHEDTAIIEGREALRIEKTRNDFFARIKELPITFR